MEQVVIAAEADKIALDKIEAIIDDSQKNHNGLKLVSAEGQEVELPDTLSKALASLVGYLADGRGVSLVPVQREITTQVAADLLNVPHAHLLTLLEKGDIPYHKIGELYRLDLAQVLIYNQKWQAERRRLLDELTVLSQELGLYDVKPEDYA